jgi:hypothetical protein
MCASTVWLLISNNRNKSLTSLAPENFLLASMAPQCPIDDLLVLMRKTGSKVEQRKLVFTTQVTMLLQ